MLFALLLCRTVLEWLAAQEIDGKPGRFAGCVFREHIQYRTKTQRFRFVALDFWCEVAKVRNAFVEKQRFVLLRAGSTFKEHLLPVLDNFKMWHLPKNSGNEKVRKGPDCAFTQARTGDLPRVRRTD